MLAVGAVLCGCAQAEGSRPDEARVDGNGSASSGNVDAPLATAEIGRLRRLFDEAYEASRRSYVYSFPGEYAAGNPFLRIGAELDADLARCSDDRCRRGLLRDALNRMRFSHGRATAPVRGMPWSNGLFRHESSAISGSLMILPLDDRHIMVSIWTSARPDARWICDVIAHGQLRPDGSATMHDIDGDPGGPFELKAEGRTRVSIGRARR